MAQGLDLTGAEEEKTDRGTHGLSEKLSNGEATAPQELDMFII